MGEQEFELDAGESVTVTGITGPGEVGAVGAGCVDFGDANGHSVTGIPRRVT